MNKYELVQRAFDSNSFDGLNNATTTGYVNPDYWDKQLFDHVRANLVVLPLGVDVTSRFPKDGDTFNHTVLGEPASASSVAETASVSIVAFSPTQVQLSPTEYGIAYQTSDKELRRAFFDVLSEFTRALGYGLALKADSLAVSQLTNSAGNSIVANGVDATAVTTSDTLDHTDIVDAMEENAVDKHTESHALIVHPYMMGALMKDSTFLTAEKFGIDKAANRNGFIGSVFGIPVYMTTQITLSANKGYALLLSASDAFAYIFKTPSGGAIAREYHALERRHDVVGVIDFDVKIARPNAVCKIYCYAA